MKLKTLNIIVCLLVTNLVVAQNIYYQDVFRGGVCVTGTATGLANGSVTLPYNIENGSTIKRVFLITYEFTHSTISSLDFDVIIDGSPFRQNQSDNDLFFSENLINENDYSGHRTHISDITDDIVFSGGDVTILMNAQTPIASCPSCIYSSPMLIILYENNSLPTVNVLLAINDEPQGLDNFLQINTFNPVDINNDIAMGIHSDRIGANSNDGYIYELNSLSIGQNNQHDLISIGGGTVGTFYYQNNTLTGLTDDVANNNLNGSDGILLINDYVGINLNPMEIEYSYIQPTSTVHNVLVGLYFAYSTPCDTFSVSTPNDTILCQGETLQLNVSGGQAYEWLPSTGLSCTDCPNPIFTADSSMFYTVRIWNNDTCSVVRPLKINVRPRPEFSSLTTTPSECGANTGTVTLNALPNNGTVTNWQEVGGATQTSNVFQNLSTGNHTFFFVDTNGCQSADTTVFVGEINTTTASFSVSPQTGAVPLTVQLTNTSQNATNYEWYIEGVSVGSSLQNWEFGNSGYSEIYLVAWQNSPSCADTASQTVFVYDSLMISVPNVFTPNGDGVNDFYTLTASQHVNYELIILNRWGNEILIDNGSLLLGVSKNVWNGGNSPDGVYFVKLKIVSESGEIIEVEDFVSLVR